MPDSPLLSIIIVAYRSRDEIAPCLASLPRVIAGRTVEVIVIDNSPGDGTGEIVRTVFPHVRYLATGENQGFGRANNLGCARSSGECVLFLNPDTVCNHAALALRGWRAVGHIDRVDLPDSLACGTAG